METNETEAKTKNGLASVFFRVLKGFWRFIRFIFRLVFGPVGLAVLVVLLLGDFWLESHGLSGATCNKWFGIGDGPLLKCKRVKAGLFNGVVLQGVSFDMNTKAGPLVVNARRIAGKLNWFGLTEDYGWIPNEVEAHGVKLDLLGLHHNSIIKGGISECKMTFEADEQLVLSLKGDSLGIHLEVSGRFANAREFIKQLPKESEPVTPDPVLSEKLEKISQRLHKIDQLSDESFIRLEVDADCLEWMDARVDCHFSMPDLLVNDVVISKFRGHLKGGMEALRFDGLNIILSRSEVFNGHGVFYPRTMELEVEVDGEMAPATACQLAGIETKDWLSHRIRIPVLSFNGVLPKCELDWRKMSPELSCSLKTSFEAFGTVVEHGDFKLTCHDSQIVAEHFSLVVSADESEYISGRLTLDLNDMSVDGELDGRIVWLERLKGYGVVLPWKILNSNGDAADFDAKLHLNSFDLHGLDVNGHLRDTGLHFLTQSCNLMDMGFSLKDGFFSLDALKMKLRDIDDAVSFSASCNILEGMKLGLFKTDFKLDALARPDIKSNWDKGLSCSGCVSYRPEGNKLAIKCDKSYCHLDWIYQTYCRRLNLGMSYVFVLFGTKDTPVEFTLDVPEWPLDNFEKWSLAANVRGENCNFGTFRAKTTECDVLVTSQAVEITNIKSLTVDDEQLRLDIRVQFSPLVFSIKDLVLKGNPALAEAFILNSNAQTIYRNIWKDIQWDKTNKPLLRMPTLIYKDGSPWTLTMTGHIEAENVLYHDYQSDKLDLVITLDLPSSLSVKPITLKTDGGDIYAEIALTFGGVPQCTFMVDGEEGHLDPKRLLTTINKDFAQYLKDIDFGENTRLSFDGEMFLGGDPRISVRGKLASSAVTWKLPHTEVIEKAASKLHELKLADMESTWSYSSNGLAWNVTKSSFMESSLRSSGVYEPESNRGEFLVLFDDLPYKNLEALTKKNDDKKKKDDKKTDESIAPGVVNGVFHGRFLAGWAGRPLHMEGGGHVAIRQGDLWNVPLLKQLIEVLPGGDSSRSTLGRISQLDADVEFLGNRLAINDVYTDGTIMSLRAKGEYYFEDQRLRIMVNGVPLQEVGILSLALRPLTWAFQAERDGTLDKWDDSKWRMKSGLLQLLNLN